jgi:hypothetical protein
MIARTSGGASTDALAVERSVERLVVVCIYLSHVYHSLRSACESLCRYGDGRRLHALSSWLLHEMAGTCMLSSWLLHDLLKKARNSQLL